MEINCAPYKLWKHTEKLERYPLVKKICIRNYLREYQTLLLEWFAKNTICGYVRFVDCQDAFVDFCEKLKLVPDVEILVFDSCLVNEFVLDDLLKQIPNLVHLGLEQSYLNPKVTICLERYLRMGKITRLTLCGSLCHPENFFLITNKLELLSLRDFRLESEHRKAILDCLSDNRTLSYLKIPGDSWKTEELKRLSDSIARNTTLRHLFFSEPLSKDNYGVFLERIQNNTSLIGFASGSTDIEPFVVRNCMAYKLCRSSSLCVAWCKHWLGRDVMRLIAQYLWATRGTRVWIREGGDTSSPNPKKTKVLKKLH